MSLGNREGGRAMKLSRKTDPRDSNWFSQGFEKQKKGDCPPLFFACLSLWSRHFLYGLFSRAEKICFTGGVNHEQQVFKKMYCRYFVGSNIRGGYVPRGICRA